MSHRGRRRTNERRRKVENRAVFCWTRNRKIYCTLLLALEQNAIMSDMAVYIDGYLSKIREWVEYMDVRYPLDCYDS